MDVLVVGGGLAGIMVVPAAEDGPKDVLVSRSFVGAPYRRPACAGILSQKGKPIIAGLPQAH
jgi:hypothetical protein